MCVCIYIYISIYLSIYLSICIYIYNSRFSTYNSRFSCVYISFFLSIFLSIYLYRIIIAADSAETVTQAVCGALSLISSPSLDLASRDGQAKRLNLLALLVHKCKF